SDSCSRASIWCPARARWRTSNCRSHTRAWTVRGVAVGRSWRSSRLACPPTCATCRPSCPGGSSSVWRLAGGSAGIRASWRAVARAIVANPALLLADEPTGNLDSHATAEVLKIFRRLNEEGRTVVLITHEPDVAAQAERVIRLSDGLVVEDRRLESAPGKRLD